MASERTLLETALARVGEFRCGPSDPEWMTVNGVGGEMLIVFPWTSVVIWNLGRDPVLATPNHVMAYNPYQRYRRRLHHANGDHSIYFALRTPLPTDIARALDAPVDDPEFVLPFTHARCDPASFLLQHVLVRSAEQGADPLFADEATCRIVVRALAEGLGMRAAPRTGARLTTNERHRDLVEDAKALLYARRDQKVSLAELASSLHTSPFHLARIFRERTGFSLHGYRLQLRLRGALERLADPGADISRVALELGFSSHSHFCDSFRRAFGVPPGRVRGRGAELRTILEAAPPTPA